MFQPARLNSAIVASCRLPLGMPRRSLLAHARTSAPVASGRVKAAHGAFVADEPVALDFDAEEERVLVAVGRDVDDAQAIAAGFALHPEFLAGAAPKCNKAGIFCFAPAFFVQETPASAPAPVRASCTMPGASPSILAKSIVGSVISSSNSFPGKLKSPSALSRRRALLESWCLFTTLECESSPARSSRDDGGDDDGGREPASLSHHRMHGSGDVNCRTGWAR